jgi:hypothetical protein
MSSELTKALAPYDNQVLQDKSILPLRACNIAIIGHKGCGKSNMMKCLIEKKESPYNKHFRKIFLISPTARKDDKMCEIIEDIGEDQYFEELTNDVLDSIISTVESDSEKYKAKYPKKPAPQYAIIYDDVIHMIKGKNARTVDRLATQNRHMAITNFFLLQKWNTFLPTLVRSNLDCIMFFRTNNKKELQSFLEEMNGDEEMLSKLYEYATCEPYSFLYINMYGTPVRYFKRFDEIRVC